MDSGLYAAYTGLMARTQALDTAANNLANVGTNGFRSHQDYFQGIAASTLDSVSTSQVGQSVNKFGVLGGNQLNLSQGDFMSTGNPLDMALQGSGFFGIQTSRGTVYTRNGSFSRSSNGVLQDKQGEPVLDVNHREITIPTGSINIASDGNISVSTPAGSAIVAKIGVFDFAKPGSLIAEGDDRLSAVSGSQPLTGSATVLQGTIEGSNEDAVHGTMQLVLVQRQAEMMQKALSVFNTDFDKTASEELPRV
jgi:flagellar basal-body rod protein FlgF